MLQLTDDDLHKLLDKPIFRRISETADELGLECYVVGGYVRDLFLERPSKDIDCVVVDPTIADTGASEGAGPGIRLAKALGRRLGRWAHVSVFRNFGTAQVKWHDEEVEFVGARRESYSRDSRKPVVEDGSLEDDLDRRDFTINALAIQLNREHFGRLIDRFDGLWDMEDGLIATPLDPDVTFCDDPLRMMRCIRFATQLNFRIEDSTQQALCRNADRIRIISQERIIDELNKIMMSPVPSIGFIEMERCGLLELILPEIAALRGTESRNGRAHKDNFYHTLEVLDNVAGSSDKDSLFLRWAALLHDIGKPRTKRWDEVQGWTFHNHNYVGQKMVSHLFRRMKLPLDERLHYVEKLVSMHMRPQVIADEEVTDSAVRRLLFESGEDIDDLMTLCEADITSKNQMRKQRFLDNFRLVRERIADLQARDNYRTWTNPVTGEEIMEALGLQPCREVGLLKQAVKDAIWESRIPSDHDSAFAFMMQEAERMGLKKPCHD
ncbi:MAG: CCA tRNA nucleotidyltransferase [Bacteroidaceae bacterium]|nr:CCA tRNA nucleotidyltransferase [Bacteroidaceae bacterium]